ncbi:uncharacterized protein T551_02779 [Pneumocystis jirovecii RU7]|uniref:DNA repair protein Rad26 n=1 Tax=Pneumocystis jirovecii (strain RU7) TaxID=1408657 RepID=A0A0W4ZHF3_PNEJ7|nr:uncharacterized protein T551_02779 [Pneumocystis jirovecii RU7]KTW27812.1 hypothetical protein T551_02779 [Pneumocystis jirovecii RU7]
MNSFNGSESSLEDVEPSFLENLDSVELEQLESEAINSYSQYQIENQGQFHIEHQVNTRENTCAKHKLHEHQDVCLQNPFHMEIVKKNISFSNTENDIYSNFCIDSNKINQQNISNQRNTILQWNNTNLSSDLNLSSEHAKTEYHNKQIIKADCSKMIETKVDLPHEMIIELQSHFKCLQLERDKFKEIAESKSRELAMTQTLLDKKQQFYITSIEKLKKQYDFSLEKLTFLQKKTEAHLNRVLTENQFQKKELENVSELIKQFEHSKKHTCILFNTSSEFPTRKEFESEEKVIDPPIKRKRESKEYTSSNSMVHMYQHNIENSCLKNNKDSVIQSTLKRILFQQMDSDKKLQFIEELFDYRVNYIFDHNNSTILDILTSYKLDGFSMSISSMIIKSISDSLSILDSILKFLLYLMDCIMTIWKSCLEQNYNEPIIYIISLVHFMIVFHPNILNELLDIDKNEFLLILVQNTISLHTTKIIKKRSIFGCMDKYVIQKCLEILNIIISLFEKNEQIIISSILEIDFILIMLNPRHDLLFIKKTLSFVSKCIFFKCIKYDTKKDNLSYDSDSFSGILDIVSKYLTEKYENYEIYEIVDLKLEAVIFLNAVMKGHVNGKNLLGSNVLVVSRLCRCLSELVSLHVIYDIRINIIQSIVLILHEIISPVNLSIHFAQPWTHYAYIVSMARLSFVEDEDCHGKDVFNDKTVELARDLLEMIVGPEEGDELYDLFHISN